MLNEVSWFTAALFTGVTNQSITFEAPVELLSYYYYWLTVGRYSSLSMKTLSVRCYNTALFFLFLLIPFSHLNLCYFHCHGNGLVQAASSQLVVQHYCSVTHQWMQPGPACRQASWTHVNRFTCSDAQIDRQNPSIIWQTSCASA